MLNGSMVFSLLGFILDSEWELRVSTLLYDFSYLSGRRGPVSLLFVLAE